MNVKRIAVISYHTCPLSDEKGAEIGGMNTYVLELSKALVKNNCIIDIYTRCVDKNSPDVVNVIPNLRIIHLPAGNPIEIPKKQSIKYIPQFTQNIIKFIEKEKLSYKFISAHYYMSGLIGLEIKNKLKIPLTITFHTLALMKNLVARSAEEREDLARIKSELLLVKRADKIIATSESDTLYLHTLYACHLEKITLLSPGVNLNLFKPIDKLEAKRIVNADLNSKIILFVGRIAPLKGIDVLLYAIKILIQKDPKIILGLWIVGESNISDKKKWSNEFKRLQEIRKLLGITTYVKFVGQKKTEELPYYYNAAEIVVMPSWYESFGIAALEAMACAVPVIASDVTGVSDLLNNNHNNLLTAANNPISLAKKIKILLTKREKREEISREVFERVQNLSWDKVADKFIQILSNL